MQYPALHPLIAQH